MNRLKLYKILLTLGVITGIIAIYFLVIIFTSIITSSLEEIEGIMIVVLIFLARISLMAVAAFYMFQRWFKQEKQYLSDLPFLFGLFFLVLTYGKILDLLWDLIYFSLDDATFLLLMKIRYLLIIITAAPMMYLSIGMILYYLSLKDRFIGLKMEAQRNKITKYLLIIVVICETLAVIMAPTLSFVILLLSIIVIASFAIIVWLFYFSYKNKALSQVNTKILTIGFAALLISQLLRSVLQFIIGLNITYVILTEIIDFFVFLSIIMGFFTKSKYPI
jgi:hypothetical protein